MTRQKFLTNAELMAEIHRSKLSYCSYLDPEHARYDAITHHVNDITPEFLAEAIQAMSRKRLKPKVDPLTHDPATVVVRVMTFEHIPLDPGQRRRGARTEAHDHVRLPFPPFKHYLFQNGAPIEVLRSHWEGGFENGHFNILQGRQSEKLGRMFMKLAERYAQRHNFRNYSYLEEMVGLALVQLSQTGLQFDESKSNNPFAFYTTVMHNSFLRVLKDEKKVSAIRDDAFEAVGLMPSIGRQMANAERYD